MRKTRASRRNLLVVFAALGIATGVLHPVGAEAKETTTAGGGASASGDGGGEITASVSVEYVTAGADGSGGGVDCWVFFGQCLFVLQAAFVKSRKSLSTSSGVRYPRAE